MADMRKAALKAWKTIRANKAKRSQAAVKAHRTRKLNALQAEYDAATSAGVKAAIRRKMNQL